MPVNIASGLLSIDRGDGNLSRLQSSEIGPTITVKGNLDGYGRSLRFLRYGTNQNPVLYSWLSSARSVMLTAFSGVAGAITSAVIFLGQVWDGTFATYPPVADVNCQDYSTPFAGVKFYYYKAPKVRASRLEILIDIILRYEIPCDTDALDLGPDDGGYSYKAINEAGQNSVLDFLRDFLAPCGRKFFFRADGYMEVFRVDTTEDPDVTLTPNDIISMSVKPPAVNAPNAVRVSANCFAYTGPAGARKTVEYETFGRATDVWTGAYEWQSHATGAINFSIATPPPGIASLPEGAIRTTTQYGADGGTISWQLIEEYGWYSPLMAVNQQDGAGVVSYNASLDAWHYLDGTWRVDQQYTFRVIRRTYIVNTWDAGTGQLLQRDTYVARYQKIDMPIATVDAAGVETPSAGFLTADGQSWWGGREFIDLDAASLSSMYSDASDLDSPSTAYEARTRAGGTVQSTIVGFNPNSDGQLVADDISFFLFAVNRIFIGGQATPPAPPVLSYKIKDRFGVTQYYTDSTGGPGFFTMITTAPGALTRVVFDPTTYVQGVATSYVVSTKPFDWFEKVLPLYRTDIIDPLRRDQYDVNIGGYFPLPIPSVEYTVEVQAPRAAAYTVNDQLRQKLAGTTIYDEFMQDNCETDDDLYIVAFDRLREHSAHMVDVETLFNRNIEEGSIVRMPSCPQIPVTFKAVAWDVTHTINGNGDCRTSFQAHYYPPNVEAA